MLLYLFACGGSAPEAHPHPVSEEKHEVKHGHDDATVHHRFDDVERWAKVFDDPARDAWQQPGALVAALDVRAGSTVADVGAGTGYFLPWLSRAVGPEGRVIAVDIEQSLVAHMQERTRDMPQVTVRLGDPEDPELRPSEVDLVLLVNTYHHIDQRQTWFSGLKTSLKPGGRLVIVDFKPGDLPVGPPPEHRIPREQVLSELTEIGWQEGPAPDVLPYQFIQVMSL